MIEDINNRIRKLACGRHGIALQRMLNECANHQQREELVDYFESMLAKNEVCKVVEWFYGLDEELKPCVDCGMLPVIKRVYSGYVIKCEKCDNCQYDVRQTFPWDIRDKAIDEWNKIECSRILSNHPGYEL